MDDLVPKRRPLGELLIELGLATREQVQAALDLQKQGDQRPIGQIILSQTEIDYEDIAKALAQQFAMDYVNLDRTDIEAAAVQLIPREFAWENIVLPYRYEAGHLLVAVFDPMYLDPLEQIEEISGLKVHPVVTTIESLDRALRRCYQGGDYRDSPLRPPPLSQRQADLRRLVGLFLKDESSQSGRIMKISRMALGALLNYNWRSVRELLDTVEGACRVAPGDVVRMEHLPKRVKEKAQRDFGASEASE